MRSTPQSAAEQEAVLAIKELFWNAIVNEIVPHTAIREVLSKHIHGTNKINLYYYCVTKARTLLNKETGIIFSVVKSAGYRRLDSKNGIGYAGERPLMRIRRTARVGGVHLSNALLYASNDLSAAERRQALQRGATLALIDHLTSAKAIKTMSESPPEPQDPLKPLRDALGLS